MGSSEQANAFLRSLINRCDDEFRLGTIGVSIYDTAWVALVSRTVDSKATWVFPESFDFIYKSQASDGSWSGDGSVVDRIINTLACLLALKRHAKAGLNLGYIDLSERCDMAVSALKCDLENWDVASTERIGFEMVVPSILESLEQEGIDFDFPSRAVLHKIYAQKLKKIDWEIIYKHHTAILFSLEAFVDKCDFDRLAHHTRDGSMFDSPASTAAYLANASKWDDRSEAYLRRVMESCRPYGYGAVSTVWPTTNFELAWGLSNLIESGFELDDLDQIAVETTGAILHSALTTRGGIVGISVSIGADADSTAKAITALRYIGKPFPLDALFPAFELPTHFQCFQFERNPSLSTNCNVLIALLAYPQPAKYSTQILKVVTFIIQVYWNTDGMVRDKWHDSPWYPAMLAAQGLLRFLHFYEQGLFAEVSSDNISAKLPPVLFTILLQILQSQHADGSWGVNPNAEETAYCILALAQLASLPYTSPIHDQIVISIGSGRAYLQASGRAARAPIDSDSHIWVGKVNYGIEHICQGYVISALAAPVPTYAPETLGSGAPGLSETQIEYFRELYSRCNRFQNYPAWRMHAWLIAGYLFLPDLARIPLDVFNGAETKEYSYLEYIPFSWTASNGMEETYANPQTMADMIIISTVMLHVTKLFDLAVQKDGTPAIDNIRSIVKSVFEKSSPEEKGPPYIFPNAHDDTVRSSVDETSRAHTELRDHVVNFIDFVWTHPRIQKASHNDRQQLKCDMLKFLDARLDQCNDSVRLQTQDPADLLLPHQSFPERVQSTAADPSGSQFCFAYMTCLLGHGANLREDGPEEDYLPSWTIKHIAQDCSTHISVTHRLENLRRGFLEFKGAAEAKVEAELQRELARICDYERTCLRMSLDQLLAVAQEDMGATKGKQLHGIVKLFSNSNEIHAEIVQQRGSQSRSS
ncbi:Ent-kaurene synthase [Mycena sanguinolenta]|nr:Ent-kaurene synthase [Mycena sanguinolenta]